MNNYPLTQAALGVESLVVTEEGSHLDVSLLDNCEAALTAKDAKIAELTDGLAAVQQQLASTQASLLETERQLATAQTNAEQAQQALTDANEAHEKALADAQQKAESDIGQLKEAHEAVLTEKDAKITELTEGLTTVTTDLEGAREALATAEQTLADKDAQIAALTSAPAPAQPQGEAPANNGTEPAQTKMRTDYPVYDGKESMTAFKARIEAWHKAHNC